MRKSGTFPVLFKNSDLLMTYANHFEIYVADSK